MEERIKVRLKKHNFTLKLVEEYLLPDIKKAAKMIVEKYKKGKKVLIFWKRGEALQMLST